MSTAVADAATVLDLLRGSGLVGANAVAAELPGGVSSLVVLVEDGERRLVVKKALAKLRVADEWSADPRRALVEAAALKTAAAVHPDAVPAVVATFPDQCAIVITAAPPTWRTWKGDLLEARVDTTVAGRLGQLLGTWHAASVDVDADGPFCRHDLFEQLRVGPYHRTVAERIPDLAEPMSTVIDELLSTRQCLVHGDYSPKNVLVGDEGLWVLDWEVAHLGAPVFDVAFMTSHLVLKAIHTGAADALRPAIERFWTDYAASNGRLGFDADRTTAHVGALLLPRVHGKSPAEYLEERGRRVASELGRELLLCPAAGLAPVWTQVS